ncbi:MAG: gamma-glutamyltransferase, partial [Lautropia sp.]
MAVDSIGNTLTQRTVPFSGEGLTRPLVGGTCHAVSAGHPLATQAAFRILEAGGNAVDAGVAAGLVLAVVQSDVVNFAGVAPMLVYSARTRKVQAIAGLGHWPRAIAPDHFLRHFNGEIPHGVQRTVVPAAPDAWITALAEFGTLRFGDVAAEAIRIAREGFVMYPLMSNIITAFADEYARWPSNARIYLPGGRPPRPGELFVQSDLAGTIQYMADQERSAGGDRRRGLQAARDAFYRGDIATAILAYHREHDGFLSAGDLETYRSPVEAPVQGTFGTYDMFTPGPWCQGPALIQILRLADALELGTLAHNSTGYIHRLVEAIKAAFDDRHRFFGDPDHVDVPLDKLLSAPHARRWAAAIDPARAARFDGAAGREAIALDT